MKVTQTATTIDASPATFTCANCPFARLIEDDRYCCAVSETAADVVRGHWEARTSCHESIAQAQAEAEKAATSATPEIETPIAQTPTPAPATPDTASHPATAPAVIPAPVAIETDNQPPNRGDGGRGRVEPIGTKKLMLTLVAVKRLACDIPACNFDRNELEIAGQLALTIGGFVIPPVVVRDSTGYKVVAGYFQYHAAVAARQLNPRAGETIPVILLESENESAALTQLKMLRLAA